MKVALIISISRYESNLHVPDSRSFVFPSVETNSSNISHVAGYPYTL